MKSEEVGGELEEWDSFSVGARESCCVSGSLVLIPHNLFLTLIVGPTLVEKKGIQILYGTGGAWQGPPTEIHLPHWPHWHQSSLLPRQMFPQLKSLLIQLLLMGRTWTSWQTPGSEISSLSPSHSLSPFLLVPTKAMIPHGTITSITGDKYTKISTQPLEPNVSFHVCSLKGALVRHLHILWEE